MTERPPPWSFQSAAELPTERDAVDPPAGAQRPSWWIIIRDDEQPRLLELEVDRELVVGRDAGCDVVLVGSKVSRRHLRLGWLDAVPCVWDLDSTNGTRVNDAALDGGPRPLRAGDVLHIGSVVLAVAETGRAAAASTGTADADAAAEQQEAPCVADRAMMDLYASARRCAASDSTVLLLGETGVGKEVVAAYIHQHSERASKPYLRLNCASLTEALAGSELFGHERGAFTGAVGRKRGYFEAANGGTLLLDEVGELAESVQAKLLRVLEQGVVVPVGSTEERTVDVRVICATHRDLDALAGTGGFRRDLYYRISVLTLRVPPLRQRPTEIEPLAERFVRRAAAALGLPAPDIDAAARAALLAHSWPGNVRELCNAMEHAAVMSGGTEITAEHLPEPLVADPSPEVGRATSSRGGMRERLALIERSNLVRALEAEGGNQTRAAERLGISRRSLIYKMRKYGLGRAR